MKNSYYELKKIEEKEGCTGKTIKYQVINFDGNEEKIQKMLEELRKNCMFYEDWYDDKTHYVDATRYIIHDITHLD